MRIRFHLPAAPGLLAAAICLTGCGAAQETPVPATQTAQSQPSELRTKITRFAPTDIAADVSKLSAPDRRALAKLIEASKVLDGIYLRQIWVGNEAMLIDLARDEYARRPRPPAFFPDQQGTLVAHRSQRVVRSGRARRSRRVAASIRSARRRKRSRSGSVALRGRARPRDRVFHGHPPGIERAVLRPFPTASSTRTSWRRRRHCCARRPSCRRSRR